MKVKIGDKIYSCADQPIMLILEDFDKKYISNMDNQTKYCSYPEGINSGYIERFMEEE